MAIPCYLPFFLSGKDKVEQFQKELKSLLSKYDAELTIEDFGYNYEKIVVNFSWDEDLANRLTMELFLIGLSVVGKMAGNT